ncbi:Bet1-like SNARE 1-2 [Sesamum angolense]|uniref:Bet1-like SNARE 1-2 n=1 Tax=Sesamum angolense TaxID=2727404 RepID=A0AAE2BK19_9LAMI|nr:Bet1-like SNARE 1-2 [Sesamum angolense]
MKLSANRDHRSSRAALFDNMDSLEEGGLRSSSSYSSGIDDHDNEKTMDSLHDRVSFLKRARRVFGLNLENMKPMCKEIIQYGDISCFPNNNNLAGILRKEQIDGDINEEVESHNRMLDRMGNEMDASRGIMSGTIDRFKMVFEKKSSRRICKLAAYFVLAFFLLYYFIRILLYFMYG